MKKIICALFTILISQCLVAQEVWNINEIEPAEEFDNIHSQEMYSDSFGTSFVIWLKKEVKLHRHDFHTEKLYVLEGTGVSVLNNEMKMIKPGDFIVIPQGIPHSVTVTSEEPMKVISIQTPQFFGKDRVYIKN